jgi:hypothetical protein
MRVKAIVDEDFTNYKKAAMFIGTISCAGKCCAEAGIPLSVCQNDGWRSCAPIEVDDYSLCVRYLNNGITNAIVFGGLEPFEQFLELKRFIHTLRIICNCSDYVVIYTGYYPQEIERELRELSVYKNIVVKFGRFKPNDKPRDDDILGVTLSSSNQYAEKIS